MTMHADGVTDADDASRRAAGAAGAGVGSGAPKAVPLVQHDADVGVNRSREHDSETPASRDRWTSDIDTLRMERARRALLAIPRHEPAQAAPPRAVAISPGREESPVTVSDVAIVISSQAMAPESAERPLTMSREQAYAVVIDARSLLDTRLPDSKAAKSKSEVDYLRKVNFMRKAFFGMPDLTEAQRWCKALDRYANNSSSFRANRAACLWHLSVEIKKRLDEQKPKQQADDRGPAWLRQIALIRQIVADYREIEAHVPVKTGRVDGMTKKGHRSKKRDLKRIAKKFPDWMSRMLRGARSTGYLDAVRMLCLVGPRPEELVMGAEVSWSPPGFFSIKLQGAKVGEQAGQPWRRIHFPESVLPRSWRQRLHREGSFVVRVASKDGLRSELQRISQHVLPNLPNATAYVFRHAFATLIRQSDGGFGSQDVAAFLGHSVAETQAVYGFRARGKSKRRIKRTSHMRVDVPRTVRPMNLSGLAKVQAIKKAGKSKAAKGSR